MLDPQPPGEMFDDLRVGDLPAARVQPRLARQSGEQALKALKETLFAVIVQAGIDLGALQQRRCGAHHRPR